MRCVLNVIWIDIQVYLHNSLFFYRFTQDEKENILSPMAYLFSDDWDIVQHK